MSCWSPPVLPGDLLACQWPPGHVVVQAVTGPHCGGEGALDFHRSTSPTLHTYEGTHVDPLPTYTSTSILICSDEVGGQFQQDQSRASLQTARPVAALANPI
jgi:hypothetical protein